MTVSSLPIQNIGFISFDLETTGLFPMGSEIVEIGAVKFRWDGEELGYYEQLIDPYGQIPEQVIRIHGITKEMVSGKPRISHALPDFMQFVGDQETVIIAHNAYFDVSFMGFAFIREGLQLPLNTVLDTLTFAREGIPNLRSYKLDNLAALFSFDRGMYHRALQDAYITKLLFIEISKEFPSIKTLGDLFNYTHQWYFGDFNIFSVEAPPGFENLAVAIQDQRSITMIYDGGTKGTSPRVVTPKALFRKNDII